MSERIRIPEGVSRENALAFVQAVANVPVDQLEPEADVEHFRPQAKVVMALATLYRYLAMGSEAGDAFDGLVDQLGGQPTREWLADIAGSLDPS